MICTLIGAVHKVGEYNGRPYDKLQLFFSYPASGSAEFAGDEIIDPKLTYFPTAKLPSMTSDVDSFHDLFNLIGCKFDVSFDQYRNLDTFRIVQ